MGGLRRFFNKIMYRLGLRRKVRPEDMPRVLPPDALDKVLAEARFLHSHAVSVDYLLEGEEPGIPKPASGEPPA